MINVRNTFEIIKIGRRYTNGARHRRRLTTAVLSTEMLTEYDGQTVKRTIQNPGSLCLVDESRSFANFIRPQNPMYHYGSFCSQFNRARTAARVRRLNGGRLAFGKRFTEIRSVQSVPVFHGRCCSHDRGATDVLSGRNRANTNGTCVVEEKKIPVPGVFVCACVCVRV